MRCTTWGDRVAAVALGFFASGFYLLERLRFYGGDQPDPPPEDPGAETVAALFILIVVPAVVVGLQEINRRAGPQRFARTAGGLLLWALVAAFFAFGAWRGAGIVTVFDAVVVSAGALAATFALVRGSRFE